MRIIKNSKELARLVNEYKDLILPDEDVRIEYEPTKEEIRNVECQNLFLENDTERFNFNGGDFNGGDFKGRNFNGWDFNGGNFNGWDFNGGDFNGGDFNGRNFKGGKISYYAVFIAYNSLKCTSWEKRRENALDPICLDGKLEIIQDEENDVKKAIKLLEEKGKLKDGKILI
jgi:hypothetical protein